MTINRGEYELTAKTFVGRLTEVLSAAADWLDVSRDIWDITIDMRTGKPDDVILTVYYTTEAQS